jgi:hypothetical protein
MLLPRTVDGPSQPLTKGLLAEVHQQAERLAREAEVVRSWAE